MNTALILHMLAQIQHMIAGHHFHAWVWVGCTSRPGVGGVPMLPHTSTGGCMTIQVAPRSVRMRW